MIRTLADLIERLEHQGPENLESEIPKIPIKYIQSEEPDLQQLKLLEEMDRIFNNYHDSLKNIEYLKGILQLFSSFDKKIMIPISNRGLEKSLFIFDEYIDLKKIIGYVLNIIKNRKIKKNSKKIPRYRGVSKKNSGNHSDNKYYIDASDIQKIRLNFVKKEKTKNSHFKSELHRTYNKTRIIGSCKENTGKIAFRETILNSIQNGNYYLDNKKLIINDNNILYLKYESFITYNIMLILDASKSTSWAIPHIEKFIPYIVTNVSKSRDKLGLLAFNNGVPKIYHYPTKNIKQIIGTINKIEIKGLSPLGEGLNLAVTVFSNERYKLSGMKNLIILISDCFPEPLEGGYKNLLDEPAYKLVLSAVKKIKNKKIGLMIIKPVSEKNRSKGWNDKLIEKIKEIIDIKYIEIHPVIKKKNFCKNEPIIDEKIIHQFVDMITDMKMKI